MPSTPATVADLAALTVADAPRYRLVVQVDDGPDSPAGWGNYSLVPTGRGDSRSHADASGPDELDLAAVLERMDGQRYPHGGVTASRGWAYPDAQVAAVIRWARVFHGVHVAYWDRAGALAYLTAEHVEYLASPDGAAWAAERGGPLQAQAVQLSGEESTYRAWADGNVYGVTLERAVTWHRDDDEPDELTTWEHVDSIWGNYLEAYPAPGESAWTAADVAAEQFGVPADVAAALQLVERF